MARYREWMPVEPLRPFVGALWMLELDACDAEPQRVVPDGHPELIVHLADPLLAFDGQVWRTQARAFFAGQLEAPVLLRNGGRAATVGISFHPHGAAGLFPQFMHELTGAFMPIEDLAPELARDIGRALDSGDPVGGIEAALCAQARRRDWRDAAMSAAVRELRRYSEAARPALIARDLGLSRRQFERRFRATVGLSPAFFARLQRFNRVYAAFDDASRNWADAAIACGYYDQAHLIRDCRALAGVTPAALFDPATDLARHFYQRYEAPQLYKTTTLAAL